MTTVIGICGNKYNGKDTSADYLVKNYGFMKLSLADPLKHALQEIFGFTNEQLWGSEKETLDTFWGTTPRELLQYIGTDLMRDYLGKKFSKISDNIWILAMRKKIIDLQNTGVKRIVIADIRFPNEGEMIHSFDGYVFRVVRDNYKSYDQHVSEKMIDNINIDKTIHNLTFEQLYNDLDEYMETLDICKTIMKPKPIRINIPLTTIEKPYVCERKTKLLLYHM